MEKTLLPDPNGILLVDKPAGITSHDVVYRIRRTFQLKKVGHGGTLDPAATGLLIMLIGKGTKLSNAIMGHDKMYDGIMRLGQTTTTQDAEGEILETRDISGITQEMVLEAMAKFKGDIYQLPPMVSALKKDGVPLYKLARKGEEIERKERFVHIYRFDMLNFGMPDSTVRVKCTKGTYIRTLCYDVGEALGCGAHLVGLRRLSSGKFSVENAMPLDQILSLSREEFEKLVVPISQVDSL